MEAIASILLVLRVGVRLLLLLLVFRNCCFGILLLLLLILAVAASGRFPLLIRPRRALEEHPDCAGPSPEGWPIAFQTLRIDLEGAHPWRASPPKVLLFLAKGQAPENRCGSRWILLLQLLSLSAHHSTSPGSTRLQNHV